MVTITSQTDILGKRSEERFELSMPFEVYGKDVLGRVFSTEALLCNASTDGGCLVIERGLARGQIMRISSPRGDVFPARVCWETFSFRTKQRHLGFKLEGGRSRWVVTNEPQRSSRNF